LFRYFFQSRENRKERYVKLFFAGTKQSSVTLNARRDYDLNRIRAFFFPPRTSFRKCARPPAHPRSRRISVSRRRSAGGVSQRWSPAAHYDARGPRRTYLRIMAIMLIIVSRAARAQANERRPGAAAFPRSGNGVCHYYGDRLTVNARYSFPSYASGCLLLSSCEKEEAKEEDGCSGEEGRSNERTQKNGSYVIPPPLAVSFPCASRRLRADFRLRCN